MKTLTPILTTENRVNMSYLLQKKNFFFVFLVLHPQHMEVPRLGVELELQLPATATVTAMRESELRL